MTKTLKVDHVGIVVKDIIEHYQTHMKHLFADACLGPIIHDPAQKVRVAFVKLNGASIELIEPAAEDSPVSSMINGKQASIYHMCFKVNDLDVQLKKCRKSGMIIVCPPKAAVAFNGNRIAFVMGRDKLLWEFVEEKYDK